MRIKVYLACSANAARQAAWKLSRERKTMLQKTTYTKLCHKENSLLWNSQPILWLMKGQDQGTVELDGGTIIIPLDEVF